jgi:Protein of unknown function (DUF3352)
MKRFVLTAVAVTAAFSLAQAQSLSKFAPANAMFAIELNDLNGAGKTAASFVAQFNKLRLNDILGEVTGSSAQERRELDAMLADFNTLVDREGFVGVYLSPKTSQAGFLLAARPALGSDAKMRAWLNKSLSDARKFSRVSSFRVGGLPVYYAGGMYYGYEGGLAYAASDQTSITEFLSRFRGQTQNFKTSSLAGSNNYDEVMKNVGDGNLRLYADLRNVTQLARAAVDAFDPELPNGIKLEPILDSITTLGRFGGAWKVTPEGIDNTTLLVPEKRGADAQLQRLLTPNTKLDLKAASVVPASAVGFSTSSNNPQAFYGWLSSLADRTGLQQGGLDVFFKQELNIDVQRSVLSWMTGEVATATFVGKGATQSLGESVTYLGTSDERAATQALETVLPKLLETGQKLAGQRNAAKFSKATLGDTTVYRYPIADQITMVAAVKSGFVMVAQSDSALLSALASGARLETSQNYRSAVARVPKDALGWSYGDTTATLKSAAGGVGQILELALPLALDLKPSTARKLSNGLEELLNFLGDRAGFAVSWTEAVQSGTKTRSFQPVKW